MARADKLQAEFQAQEAKLAAKAAALKAETEAGQAELAEQKLQLNKDQLAGKQELDKKAAELAEFDRKTTEQKKQLMQTEMLLGTSVY